MDSDLWVAPNPANPDATIRWSTGTARRLLIYDTLGRLVRMVDRPTGENWQVRGLVSGVYLAVLETGEGKRVCKFTVLK